MGAAHLAAIGVFIVPGPHTLDEHHGSAFLDAGFFIFKDLVHFKMGENMGMFTMAILVGLILLSAGGNDMVFNVYLFDFYLFNGP